MKDKKYLWITSLIILLPCVAGVLLWNQLPEKMVTHFGASGQADGWSGKLFAVFGMPMLLLAAHWLCVWASKFDRRNWSHNEKLMKIIFWVFPGISLAAGAVTYSVALGQSWNISRLVMLLMGVLFVAMGNYLPKCRQNASLGIKLYWTLYNEENWNKTHRFGGKCWVAAGFTFFAMSLLPVGFGYVTVALLLGMVLLPVGYSWLLYRKQVREGTWVRSERSKAMEENPNIQRMRKASIPMVAGILILVAVLMFTGDISVSFEADCFVVDATYGDALTVEYDRITSVEYRSIAPLSMGSREWGFASGRLLLGLFRNEEFGQYTRYTYTGADSFVIVHCGEKVLVLSGRTQEETEQLALMLSEKLK